MSKKGVPQTEVHKQHISESRKGQNLNFSRGKLVIQDGKKLCSSCSEWKDLLAYDKRPERPSGVRAKCKPCNLAYRNSPSQITHVKFAQYKCGAKKRGIEFNLSKEEFMTLWQAPCSYCADEIETIGIDRIDSNQGYFIKNVVSCCAICNVMKLALPREVFISHCQKVVNNQI